MEEWEEHFKRLLEGVENMVVRGDKRRKKKIEEKEISKEEINSIIRKMKNGKAAELDDLPGEVWKYGGKEMMEWIWSFCNKVWKVEGWRDGKKEQ